MQCRASRREKLLIAVAGRAGDFADSPPEQGRQQVPLVGIKNSIRELSVQFDRSALMFGDLPTRRQHRRKLVFLIDPPNILVPPPFMMMDQVRPVLRNLEDLPAVRRELRRRDTEDAQIALRGSVAEADRAEQQGNAFDGLAYPHSVAARLSVFPKPCCTIPNTVRL